MVKWNFNIFFCRQLSEICEVLRVSFEALCTLCSGSRIGSSFYPTVSLAYLN